MRGYQGWRQFRSGTRGRGRGTNTSNKKNTKPKIYKERLKHIPKADILEFNVITWNVEGKGSPEDVDKALMKTLKKPADIVCLQEANFPQAGEETENFKWYCSGALGSAILVNKAASVETGLFKQVCDQICMVEVTGKNGNKTKVISCYIPPPTDYLSEDLWIKLAEVLKSINSNLMFILAGDFNAEIGSTDKTDMDVGVGKLLHNDVCNEHGIKLKKLLREAHLRAISTSSYYGAVGGPDSNCFTYKNAEMKSQRDFIIIPYLRNGYADDKKTNDWHPDYKHAMHGVVISILKIDTRLIEEPEEGPKKAKFVVSTWNIQGATPAKVDSVLNEHNLPIICVQELFLTSEEDIKTENYTWFCSKKQWSKNVGILVKISPDISVTNFEPLSDCLCVADVVFHDRHVKVISCYLPVQSDPRHEAVVTQLNELVKGIPQETLYVLTGDFNIKNDSNKDESTSGGVNEEDFVLKLLEGMDLSFKDSLPQRFGPKKFKGKSSVKLVSKITETGKSNPHLILVPKNYKTECVARRFAKWVQFFENSIVCVSLKERDPDLENTKGKAPRRLQSVTEGKEKTNKVKEEVISGVIHKTKIYEYYEEDMEEENEAQNLKLLSPDDLEKFKSTSPSAEELGRILEDFVIYQGTDKRSYTFLNPVYLLINSFKLGGFGKITIEETHTVEEATDKLIGRICKIKWNNILLAESTGTDREPIVRKKAANALIDSLGQVFYTVMAKRSYFNKTLPPILKDDPKLANLYKPAVKKSLPTMEDITKHIEEQLAEFPDSEIVFGKDFSENDLKDIRNYAKEKNLAYRFFTSSLQNQHMDHIGVSKKYTPQERRDKLLSHPDDCKYYLIPPCGLGKDYKEFVTEYTNTNLKDEVQMIHRFYDANYKKKPESETVKKTSSEKPKENQAQKVEGKPKQNGTQPNQKQQGTKRKQGARQSWNSQDTGRNRGRDRRESQYSGGRQRNDSVPVWQSQETGIWRRSGDNWGQSGNTQQYDDLEPAPSKRQRLDTNEEPHVYRVETPYWRDLAPLVIVWPVTVRSIVEERPKMVLESNFPVEFPKSGRSSVATLVTLPLRNGRTRQYCLSVAETMYRAAETALQILKKHCTIIKHNQSYLCDGRTPNFIRYKVPCQFTPRTYIILSLNETGPLTSEVVRDIFETFEASFNEDLFFDKDGYTLNEKTMLLDNAPKYNFKVRHFGDSHRIAERYVCISKIKSNNDILEEVLKMRDFHPKYQLAVDRLPPRLGLNIF